jgi:hypothetical protein
MATTPPPTSAVTRWKWTSPKRAREGELAESRLTNLSEQGDLKLEAEVADRCHGQHVPRRDADMVEVDRSA